MTERAAAAPSARAAPAAPPLLGAGALLRQRREAAGVKAAFVASALKVPLYKLEALEDDRYDLLPDITFARGLAAAVCRGLGTDPAPVLERMPAGACGLHPPDDGINQPFRRPGDRPTSMVATRLFKWLLIAAAMLLVGMVALWLLPTPPIQLSTPPEAAAPTPVAPGMVRESVDSTTPPAPVESSADAASAGQQASAAAPASAPAVADKGKSVLDMSATGQTWVSVRDATDKVLVSRTLNAGESVSVDSSDLPLTVTIGRKDAVAVTVRGKPLDLKPLGPSDVARFQIK